VLVRAEARGLRIMALNDAARRAGAHAGQPLADARAACPGLIAEQSDDEADEDLHGRLAAWALRWTPIVARDGSGLMLDITGCAHLFGGEARLLADLRRRFCAIGFGTEAAVAPTPAAARALAGFGPRDAILEDHAGVVRALGPLPVEALGLDGGCVLLLRRLGLKTIGDLAAVPRISLERRFRSADAAFSVRLALDRLNGDASEPLDAVRPAEPHRFVRTLAEPLIDHAGVAMALDDLLVAARHRLEAEGCGARLFTLTAFHADGGVSTASVRLSEPARDDLRIARLFRPRLPEIDCGHGIDGFVLAAGGVAPLVAGQPSMQRAMRSSTQSSMEPEDAGGVAEALCCDGLAPLIDTLSNRLGARGVFALEPVAGHWPERAQRPVAAIRVQGGGPAAAWREAFAAQPGRAARPFRLFDRAEPVDVVAEVPDGPPMRFVWRRVSRRIVHAAGPERIAPEWWRADAQGVAVRDYFAVEDEDGRRFWLYRAGPYGGAEPPRWFVHGVFS
jgi:protein ImuB